MKKVLSLTFCICVVFSSICLAENKPSKTQSIFVAANTVTKKDLPNIFRPIGDLFTDVTQKVENEQKEMIF